MEVLKVLGSKTLGLLSRVSGRPTGWKQAATVNCILLFVISIVLIGLLIATAMQARGIENPVFFYEGPCKENSVSYINFFYIYSSISCQLSCFASTNFFMQILNAPTREEIDVAHLKGTWLEIGVSSSRNVFRVSKLKTYCCLGLLVSSIPIHLLFNSTVFTTERKLDVKGLDRESNFHLTIATEEFLNGGSFFPPGASLVTAEIFDKLPNETILVDSNPDIAMSGYGTPGSMKDYADKESAIMNHISLVANFGRTWDRIDVSDCLKHYLFHCNGLDRHRDLILVIDKPGGWTRNEMWPLSKLGYDALGYNSSYWDLSVPANASNHLFYYTACAMSPSASVCLTDCDFALGGYLAQDDSMNSSGSPYQFFTPPLRDTYSPYTPYTWKETVVPTLGSDNLTVQYCLADPLESTCYIGISAIILFAVTISVVIKSGIAVFVTIILSRRTQSPLVTIGDSIASFLEKPDANTEGFGALGLKDQHQKLITAGSREWQALNERRATVIPDHIWIKSYFLFYISVAVCGCVLTLLIIDLKSTNPNFWAGGFFESNINPVADHGFTILTGILTANSPQLLLSASYLAYNGLFTRLQMAQEWVMYGTGYYPLRVTNSEGMQKSTYRLQLPYRYSLPLITVSAFLHFTVSNTVYVIVSFGGYLKSHYNEIDSQPGLPEDSAVVIGYSPISLIVVLIVTTTLVTIPIILSFKKLPPNMVTVGSNSLAISAACHASSLSQAIPDTQTQNTDSDGDGIDQGANNDNLTEMTQRRSNESTDLESASMPCNHDLESITGDNVGVEHNIDVLGEIARSKIRWGVVKMPPEWYRTFTQDDEIGHLSFGVEKDEVSSPEPGRWYV